MNLKKVFIASRFGEFSQIRKKLKDELLSCNMYPIDLNDNKAVDCPPIERSLRNIRESDIVILLIGDTYGEPPVGEFKSYTHLEYEEAVRNDIPIYPFAIGKSYKDGYIDYSNIENMNNWQKSIGNNHTLSMFDENEDVGLIVHRIITSVYEIENQTWYDEETGLMWQVKIDATEEHGRMPWNNIFKYCDNKNKENFGGFNDWRIPTFNELETLITDKSHPNCFGYDEETFIKKPLLYSMSMKYGRFWSSSSNNENYNFAYGINFNRKRENSQSKKGKKEKYKTRYVRCVRLWRNEDIQKEWLKVKNSKDKNFLLSFKNKFPDSKYQSDLNKILETIRIEEEKYLDSLNPIERKLLSYNNQGSMPKATLLFNAIKEGIFDENKHEALIELKKILKNENLWKETSKAKNPKKDKKYLKTLEVIEFINEYR